MTMLSSTLTAMLDTALNAWLRLGDDSAAKLQAIAGKVICIHITGLNIKLYFFPDANGIYTMTEYAGQADVTIKASPISLLRLNMASDRGKTLLDSDVNIEGDMGLSEKFSQILTEIDVDWEEWLSHLIGDIAAYQLGEGIRKASHWCHETQQAMQMNTSEYLQEEIRVLPAEAEVAYYMEQVDTLRADTDRLEARLKRLQSHIEKQQESS